MVAIEVREVYKTFRIPHERHTTLTENVLSVFRPMTYERFAAVAGVSLAVEAGTFVGIIGRNGSGKSTLLKLITGLLVPDAGAVRVNGSMCELFELGLGFSPELTVRENVSLYAALLKYPRRDRRARIEHAIAFAELGRFTDTKLKSLSTGMCLRLGFSAAVQAETDILILDEVLAVGDAEFQRKCLDTFSRFKREGKTIVLVSHDMEQVRRFCDWVVVLDAGRVVASGRADAMIERYLEFVRLDPPAGGAACGC
jgi:ABC-type polysaccharide/polyol phosphate transport system ATPase subunit